jgi:hypothetical protein
MPTITIPRELVKDRDLVAVPRVAYKQFLSWLKSVKLFKPTVLEKKALQRSRRNFAKGEYTTLDKLKNDLAAGNR